MSSTPGNLKMKASLAGRTRRTSSRRQAGPRRCRAPRSFNNGGRKRRCSKAVSAKLETLKSLINPSSHAGKGLKADELFQETADYIVLLRTQVVILQRLVEFYGSSEKENIVAAVS